MITITVLPPYSLKMPKALLLPGGKESRINYEMKVTRSIAGGVVNF